MELGNVAAERAVLSGICNFGKEAYLDVEYLLEEDTFTVDHNKVLYKCLTNLISKVEKVDFVGILSSANDLGLEEYVNKQEILKHIQGIMNTPVELSNVRNYAKKLRRLQYARQIQRCIKDSYQALEQITGDEPLAQIVSLVEDPLTTLSLSYVRQDDTKPKLISDGLKEYIQDIFDGKVKKVGISSSFPSYDESIGGGFLRGGIDLVGARTKAGKSIFADNVALFVSNLGIPVLMLDTEMRADDHWNRILANISGVKINDIKLGKITSSPEKMQKVREAYDHISKIPYHYKNITGKPFSEVISIARRWILKEVGFQSNGRTNDCLIIYDYLKLTSSDSVSASVQEYQALGFQMIELHNFVVEYDVPCLSFVQLNRDGITKESSDVISQSDRIGWVCTSFSILKEKSEEEKVDDGIKNGNRKLVPVLSRHGPGIEDNGYICIQMDGDVARMKELGTIRQLKKNRDLPQVGTDKGESKPANF